MKATLGLGFEDSSEAVDFGICLQEARKVLGFEEVGKKGKGEKKVEKEKEKRDWSLKEGETIRVDVGGRRGRRIGEGDDEGGSGGGTDAKAALFSIKPPPPSSASLSSSSLGSSSTPGMSGVIPMLAPPPSAGVARAERRRSRELAAAPRTKSGAEAAGFDDGEFGEFQ